jgi:transcriptional regulator with XRE-family HTH domain
MLTGAIIRAARLRAGLTQGELGHRVDRDASEISRWERGAVAPSFDVLRELVSACGLRLAWSLLPDDESYRASVGPRLAQSPEQRVRTGIRHSRRTQQVARLANGHDASAHV